MTLIPYGFYVCVKGWVPRYFQYMSCVLVLKSNLAGEVPLEEIQCDLVDHKDSGNEVFFNVNSC